jgi:O-6-methylguanine DNA methyltransferase
MTVSAIAFTIRDTNLGSVLLAASERGVCQLRFGSGEAELADDLAREFPFAQLRRDDARLGSWSDALVAYVEGRAERLDLPLDVAGSRFQRRVWDALRAIPRGETRSYSELATRIGQPRAVRAVAGACAANPVAVAIPCHRVVPARGGAGGYRWGSWRKQALLERESGAGQGPPEAKKTSRVMSSSISTKECSEVAAT